MASEKDKPAHTHTWVEGRSWLTGNARITDWSCACGATKTSRIIF